AISSSFYSWLQVLLPVLARVEQRVFQADEPAVLVFAVGHAQVTALVQRDFFVRCLDDGLHVLHSGRAQIARDSNEPAETVQLICDLAPAVGRRAKVNATVPLFAAGSATAHRAEHRTAMCSAVAVVDIVAHSLPFGATSALIFAISCAIRACPAGLYSSCPATGAAEIGSSPCSTPCCSNIWRSSCVPPPETR